MSLLYKILRIPLQLSMASITHNILCSMTNASENLNYQCRICKWFMRRTQSQSSFWVSLISPCFFFLGVIYIWMHDKRPETLYQARPLDTWYIEQCISKANIIMNWICVYVCGPTLGCLWRCPKSNTPISRINRPPFSIPRSPEMKRSFFHNYHLRQSIAGELDLSLHNPSPLRSHQAWFGVTPLPRKLLWTAGKCTSLRCRPKMALASFAYRPPPPPMFLL